MLLLQNRVGILTGHRWTQDCHIKAMYYTDTLSIVIFNECETSRSDQRWQTLGTFLTQNPVSPYKAQKFRN